MEIFYISLKEKNDIIFAQVLNEHLYFYEFVIFSSMIFPGKKRKNMASRQDFQRNVSGIMCQSTEVCFNLEDYVQCNDNEMMTSPV